MELANLSLWLNIFKEYEQVNGQVGFIIFEDLRCYEILLLSIK